MENLIEIETKTQLEEQLNTEELVILDFYANWCGPCKMLSPVLGELSTEFENIKILKLNVDNSNNQQIASDFGVRGIPAVFFYKNNQEVDRFVGFKKKEEIIKIIETHN